MISIPKPTIKTIIVFCVQPFHSLRIIPQTLEKVTLSDIKMHHENVNNTGEDAKNPLPKLKPKNWLYHKTPARAQNKMLFAYRDVFP